MDIDTQPDTQPDTEKNDYDRMLEERFPQSPRINAGKRKPPRGRPVTELTPERDVILDVIHKKRTRLREVAHVLRNDDKVVLDFEITEAIGQARFAGCTWKMIGVAMGTSSAGAYNWFKVRRPDLSKMSLKDIEEYERMEADIAAKQAAGWNPEDDDEDDDDEEIPFI